jgi:hypothetical protein
MAVFLDENGFIPALEQMADPAVPFVEELGVNAVQLPHAEREVSIRCFYEQVEMVGHETVGVADPVVTFIHVLKGIEEVGAILIVFEDGFLLIAAGSDVVYGARIFYAEGTGHGIKIA